MSLRADWLHPLGASLCVDRATSRAVFVRGHAVIYAIGQESGRPIKIGRSGNAFGRLEALQTATWVQLKIHRLIYVGPRRLSSRLELEVHKELATFRMPGARREWFDVDVAAFDVAIAAVVAAYDR